MRPGQLRTRLLLSLTLGLAVFIGLVIYGDVGKVAGSLGNFRWTYLPAIIGLTLFNYLIRFVKWEYYLRLIGVKNLPLWDSLLIFLSGLSMTITPAKVGEWLKSYLLRERNGIPISKSAPIIAAERITDGFGMILLAIGGLLLFKQGWVFIAFAAFIGLATVIALRYGPVTRSVVSLANRTPIVHRYTVFIENFYESAHGLFSPKPLAIAVVLGFISWLGEGFALYFVFLGLGAPNGWELMIEGVFILSIGTLAGVVFLAPGGLVVTEGGIAGLSKLLVGLSQEAAATATLIIRICTLWFGVAIGIVALLIFTRRLRQVMGKATFPEPS